MIASWFIYRKIKNSFPGALRPEAGIVGGEVRTLMLPGTLANVSFLTARRAAVRRPRSSTGDVRGDVDLLGEAQELGHRVDPQLGASLVHDGP